jgi:hypothetical protein
MQVNRPVVDEDLNVLVPTQIKLGTIRATDRLIKHGLLGLADGKRVEDILEIENVRKLLLRNAIQDTFVSRISNRLPNKPQAMEELHCELQKVARYAKWATFNCHHLVPQSNLNGCLRTYYPNTNQLLTFDAKSVCLAERQAVEKFLAEWSHSESFISQDLKLGFEQAQLRNRKAA